MAIDGSGNVFIADAWDDKILRIDDAGGVSVLVGLGQREFRYTLDAAVDASGNAYVALSAPPPPPAWSRSIRAVSSCRSQEPVCMDSPATADRL